MDRKEYEKKIKRIQRDHFNQIEYNDPYWQPCLHDNCTECHGTGIKRDGGACIHMISCSCPKCSPRC